MGVLGVPVTQICPYLRIKYQGCRKVMKSGGGGGGGGGNISDYVLLVVPYTSREVLGHTLQKIFGIFCALRQQLFHIAIASILTR